MLALTETGFIAEPIRILIIDDDPFFPQLIGPAAEMLGYTWESANNLSEAMLAIKKAKEDKIPFSIVTIDIQFKMEEGNKMPVGKTILHAIKSQYSNIACIVISGSVLPAHEILNLRDDYDLDYYISKDRLDPDVFAQGIKRALKRINPLGNPTRRREILLKTLEKYKDICIICAQNLASVEEKKALRGIDVSVDIENQIKLYQNQLEEAENKIREITEELSQLIS